MHFIARLLISALGLALASYIIPGFYVRGIGTLLIAAFLLGIANAIIRPVLFILTIPITIVTLGLFIFILNAAMIALVAWVLPGFSISGFWAALGGWLVVAIISWAASQVFKKDR